MKRLVGSLCLMIVLLPVCSLGAADWPTFLGGNDRIGATSDQLKLPLAAKWVYTAPAAPHMAWEGPRSEPIEGKLMRHRVAFDAAFDVAAVGDRLYFGSSADNKLYCVRADSGEEIWSFHTDGPIRLAPTVWQDKVYVGSDDGLVYCLDAQSGSVVWSLRVGPADERLLARGKMISRWPVRTGVLIDDGVAYFGAGVFPHEKVFLCAADAESGSILWRNDHISDDDAGRNDLSPQGYLLASDEILFIPSGRSMPAAFSKQTGEEIYKKTYSWRTTAGGVVGGSRALLADGQLYSQGAQHYLAINQENGAVGFAFIAGRQLVVSGDKAFVADGERIAGLGRLAHAKATVERQALDLKRYNLQRNRGNLKTDEYQKQYADLTRQIRELSSVGSVWETESPLDSSLIVAGELVIAGGQGQVAAFDAADGKLLWREAIDGDARGLAVAGGRLFVSTDTGKIYAFASSAAAPRVEQSIQRPGERAQNPFPRDDLTAMYEQAAQQIVERSGVSRGFCLVLGSEQGRLAYELANRTDLTIYGIEPDAEKAATARRALDDAGWHGSRITIVQGDPAAMPFANYFANLIVSDTLLLSGKLPGDAAELARRVKPCGGVVCLGAPESTPAGLKESQLGEMLAATGLGAVSNIETSGGWATLTRGKLPGAGQWSHQYGDVGNTSTSNDQYVKGGLGVLWYGDPGPAEMINRHAAASAPLSTNGRMFVQGMDNIRCYDAYNGQFLWEYKNPGALRTGVFNNEETNNLAASDDYLFVAVGNTCTLIDAATGKVRTEFETPDSPDGLARDWGYVAYTNGLLFGTSTLRSELERALRRRGRTVKSATDAVFAVDLETGQRKWLHRGGNIMHQTIAIGDGQVYFIDSSITQAERDSLLREDKEALKQLGPEEAKKKEAELKAHDVRRAICLDMQTGDEMWARPVDVTNCSRVGIGGGQLTIIHHDGHVLICGANANGHYWRQFLSGQFQERRLVVLDSKSGKLLWSKDANYRHRPIVVGDEIYAEPWAFDIHTGVEKTRQHPVTGQLTKWQFSRPGHHCGPITATPNMLFFRSGFTGYYDLISDSGASHFGGQRPGCWVNVIPGNGLVMVPESSAGCVCQFSLTSTVVLEPRADRDTWRIYSATGAQKPVQRLAVNLAAAGDRRDEDGKLWLAYPRPKLVGRLEYNFDAWLKFDQTGDYLRSGNPVEAQGSAAPFIYTTGVRGLSNCQLDLLEKSDSPASYTVRLHFVDVDNSTAGERPFDIKLQGEVAASGVDVAKESGGAGRALVREFKGVPVAEKLAIDLVAADGKRNDAVPLLAGVEVERE